MIPIRITANETNRNVSPTAKPIFGPLCGAGGGGGLTDGVGVTSGTLVGLTDIVPVLGMTVLLAVGRGPTVMFVVGRGPTVMLPVGWGPTVMLPVG